MYMFIYIYIHIYACFWLQEPQSLVEAQAEFRRIIIGLAVCLAIAIVFSVVLIVIIGRDGILRMKARREGNQPMINQPAYANSEQVRFIIIMYKSTQTDFLS